ncbi:PEP-CTERM sorting domain-containing protein [Sulfuriroseicoccus oceanibius]|uniref:PEP-CTERM sorting domain-containing protein n=1 Tax=Sulfuriroseicoccus oceanibius TaxID=2707525 RepID=A0A6B3LAN4_9BACT|nr:PEP-CTERM sorting domain-containing protein [Sulfuriroseicoccus oceanibius]QQL46089.1 PEP-CTERM sorting domain-containing protein [Sulfuriroseicoccus oceanibius]
MNKTISVLAGLAMAVSANAATLAINFTGSTNTSVSGDLYGVTQADWNNVSGGGSTPTDTLVTSDTGQSATVTFSGRGTYRMNGTPVTVEESLFHGYLDDANDRGVTISLNMGAIATGFYTVTIFSASDNGGGGFNDITVNGVANSVTNDGNLGGLSNAHATTVVTGVTGDLSITTPVRNGSTRSSIAGFTVEYTAVPEPSSAALLGLGGLALILRRRK